MQEWIKIGNVDVPVIIDEGGEKWYPISYIVEKIMLRSNVNSVMTKGSKDLYKDYIHKIKIKFGDYNVQEANCINEVALKLILGKTQVGRLSVQQRKSQNGLYRLLGLELLNEEEAEITYMSRDKLLSHDKYTREIIQLDIEDYKIKEEELVFRLCSKCNKYHPLTSKYFMIDSRASLGFGKICKVCNGTVSVFAHIDLTANKIMREGGKALYDAYKDNKITEIYEAYRNGKLRNLPDCYKNKDDYLKLIKYLYDEGELDKDNLNYGVVLDHFKLRNVKEFLNLHEIYTHLFGEDYYLYPWRYKKFNYGDCIELTEEIGLKVFRNYIDEFNIDFSKPLELDYEKHIRKARLTKLAKNGLLQFAIKYNDYKYAGYVFKTKSGNYYNDENNLLFDLKYLVEKDMKIEIEKIPLYITKNVLQKRSLSLYNFIVTKDNGSLFYWFNRLYPDKFIETDFDINAYRLEFDSDTECFIHDILKEKFKNRLIYNQRNGDREIRLGGMSPDWFIMTNKGVWIIEYFGMWNWKGRKNDRLRRYMYKTITKLKRYKEISGYKKLYLFSEDIEDDYRGIVEKIKVIENEIENS